jgi:hypothetical protein
MGELLKWADASLVEYRQLAGKDKPASCSSYAVRTALECDDGGVGDGSDLPRLCMETWVIGLVTRIPRQAL